MLTDSHAHLNDSRLDYKQIIADMTADGLSRIITVGYDAASSKLNALIAKENKNVFAAAGIHPNDANTATEQDLKTIAHLCGEDKVIALGEIGLDYHYPNTNKQKQQDIFVKQLQIAKAVSLPVIIHLRDAYADMRTIVAQNLDCFSALAVMHCFSGSKEEAAFYLDKGFYISFAGPVTFTNAHFEDVIRFVPLDKMLIETDCPYLAPHPFRGKTNYPKYVRHTCQKIASTLNKPFEEIALITSANAARLFRLG